jgi:D-3-phosphoglycerate dehydrogenase
MGRVLITPKSFSQAGPKPLDMLRAAGHEIIENKTGKTLTEEQMKEMCADIDGIIVGIDPVTSDVLKSAKRLKAISKYGAGVDNIDMDTADKLGMNVKRAAGTNAESVAELAVGMFFVLARGIAPAAASTKKGGWDRTRGIEIKGKTAGIFGLGQIGREVARMAAGLGMNILGYDPYVAENEKFLADYGIKLADQDEIMAQADFITLHLPLTEETRYMINGITLESMKKSAFLVNTSRGELVNEEALFEALKSGRIAGAASDVFSKEPPAGSPLLELDSFVLTPHIGAYTAEANERMALVSAQNLIDMLAE